MSRRQVSSCDLDSPVPKIVLIGSTGVGKSRLGSFLVSPATVDCSESELIFRSGADASAVTDRLARARVCHSGSEFDVVDTPGLGENATADAKHKSEILHLLKTSPNVAAIIFCFRQGRIEQSSQEGMDFVRQLINAKLLASNFVLVATHVSQGRRAKAERQQIGLPLDAMLHEAASKLGLAFGVHEHLTCFDIDTAPETDAAQAHALARREDIFAAIKACPLSKTSCSAKIPALAAHKGWLPALDGKGASDVQSAVQDVQGKIIHCQGLIRTCKAALKVGHHYLDAVLEELFYARQSKSEVQQLLAQRKESLKGIAKLNNQWTFIEQHIQQLKHQLSDLQAQSQH